MKTTLRPQNLARAASSNLRRLFMAARNVATLIRAAHVLTSPDSVRMSSSVIEFDPYRTWLNVNDAERPPGVYQILGLQPLETSHSRIRLAYEGQCDAMRRVENGADPRLWEDVKRALDTAFAILQDP